MARKYNFNWKEKKEEIKKEEKEKQQFGDSRFWKLAVDSKTKKGSAILRFLPDKTGTPYKQYFSHWFKYEGPRGEQLYADNCATTISENCPVCEKNREYWKSPFERDKSIARDRKRKMHYVANILVLKDPANSDNEGKVFLFDFGAQIFAKYKESMFGPEDMEEGEEGDYNIYVPCDFDEGADFNLRSGLRKGTDWVTYEPSKFKTQSRIFDNLDDSDREDSIDKVMEKTYNLDEWVDPKKYPVETEVRTKLASILGGVILEDDNPTTPQDEPEVFHVDGVKSEQPDDSVEEPTEAAVISEDMTDEQFFEELG